MVRYIAKRLGYSILVVLGVIALTFLLFDLSAGDPAAAVLGKNATSEEIEGLRRELGADLPLFFGNKCQTESYKAKTTESGAVFIREFPMSEPVVATVRLIDGSTQDVDVPNDVKSMEFAAPAGLAVRSVSFYRIQRNPFNSRFGRSLCELVSFSRTRPYVSFFNFGRTLSTREPIREILERSIVPSMMLMFPVFIGENLVGIIIALFATAFRGRLIDRLTMFLAVCGMSVSYLVVIIFSQWFLGYYLSLFPLWGFDGPVNLCLPVLVGVLCGVGANVRFYRTVFVDELHREYLRTAVAKGASPMAIYGKHLLRNAALQIITRCSATLPFLFTGSLLLESFFGIPGLGFAGVGALYNSDIQLLKAVVVLSAALFVVINLVADLTYAWADPRVRLG